MRSCFEECCACCILRYVIDARAFAEFALTNLFDTEASTTTAIETGNTTIEVKVPRKMKPGDFLQARACVCVDTASLTIESSKLIRF